LFKITDSFTIELHKSTVVSYEPIGKVTGIFRLPAFALPLLYFIDTSHLANAQNVCQTYHSDWWKDIWSTIAQCKLSTSQLEGWVFDPLSELPSRSLVKSVHLNRPGKKHNSGSGLPPIAGS